MASAAVTKNGVSSREPDWGRFGLNEEKQPLNPSGAGKNFLRKSDRSHFSQMWQTSQNSEQDKKNSFWSVLLGVLALLETTNIMISFRTETGGSNGGGGKGPAKDLYGGQAQNENELFAQDQVKWIDFQPKRCSVWITTCTFSAL